MQGALTSVEAFDISRVDAIYQIELWGEDEEQAEITAALRAETETLGTVLKDLI
jgi:chaperone required for assembly of F1-ATPase